MAKTLLLYPLFSMAALFKKSTSQTSKRIIPSTGSFLHAWASGWVWDAQKHFLCAHQKHNIVKLRKRSDSADLIHVSLVNISFNELHWLAYKHLLVMEESTRLEMNTVGTYTLYTHWSALISFAGTPPGGLMRHVVTLPSVKQVTIMGS